MLKKNRFYIIVIIMGLVVGACATHKYNHKKPCDCLNVKDNPRANKHK
jgi:hypothetical protein